MMHSSMTDFTSSTTVQVLTEAPRPTVSLTTSPESVHSATLTTYLATTTSISCLPERVSESVHDVKVSMNNYLSSLIHSLMSDFSSSTTVQMLTKPPTVSLTTSPESEDSVTPTTYLATSSIPCLPERVSESMCKSDFSLSTTVQMLTKPPTVSLTTYAESVHSVTPMMACSH